jgi:predicted NAD-dependent protein-ADP-ribosyltransferase YbiA (DUF1768 family)
MTREIDEFLNKPVAKSESQEDTEHWTSKVAREARVFGSAAVGSVQNGFHEAINDPTGTALRGAAAFGLGFGLAGLSRGAGTGAFLAKSVGVGFGVSFASDLADANKFNAIGKAWSDTWKSADNADASQKLLEHHVGRFAFDALAMTGVGAAGGYAGGKFFKASVEPTVLPGERLSLRTNLKVEPTRLIEESAAFSGRRSMATDVQLHDTTRLLGEINRIPRPVEAIGPAAKDGVTSIQADGSKIIYKPDGHIITVDKAGMTSVQKPDGSRFTRAVDGTITRELPGGKTAEVTKLGDVVKPGEPLNVFSRSEEALGRQLSNFAHTPFKLDGVEYASVEAFYASLKMPESHRAAVRGLFGVEAKNAGRGYNATRSRYNGQEFELGGEFHHELMKRAIRAKIEQNPALKEAFLATGNRPITHDTGAPERSSTRYPNEVFARTLTEVRTELGAERTARSSKDVALSFPKPLSEVLKDIKDPIAERNHSVSVYAEAMKGTDYKVTEYIGAGSDSMAFRLENGNVLKVTGNRTLQPDMGSRPFDLPILEQGVKQVGKAEVRYFVQPHAEPATASDVPAFFAELNRRGYHWEDPGASQIGKLNGQVKLLDPFAVIKISDIR